LETPADRKPATSEHDIAAEAAAASAAAATATATAMATAAAERPEVTSAANQALSADIAKLRAQVLCVDKLKIVGTKQQIYLRS
jgi:hypothetical protein